MNESTFDAFVRRTANALDRRSLLGALSGAVMMAAIDPLSTEARKGKKDKKAKRRKKREKREAACEQMELDCLAGSKVYCKEKHGTGCCPDPAAESQCLSERLTCCFLYGACKEAEGNACIFNMV